MAVRNPKPSDQRVLEYLQRYIGQNGYAPTYRQIAEAAGLSSTSAVNYVLNKLEDQGHITRGRGVARAIGLRAR